MAALFPDARAIYRFGDCELDIAARELRRNGAPVRLQPKVFELLVYLIEHRDRAVDKNEIQEAIWRGVIVTETSLTQAIRKARLAIGDDADAQSMIRTVHGHGYRFVGELLGEEAPIIEAPVQPPQPEASSQGRPLRRPKLNRRTLFLVLVAVLLLAGAGAWWWSEVHSPFTTGGVRLAVLPVENATGEADWDWVRLGLMSIASGTAAESGAPIVADANVVSAVAPGEAVEPDARALEILKQAYGATHWLALSLDRSAGLLRLTARLHDGEGLARESRYVGEDPVILVRSAMIDILRPLRSAAGAQDSRVISEDPFVNEAYARGRSLALEGRCKDALSLFSAAAQQAPQLFDPRFELAVCTRTLGDSAQAEALLTQLIEESTRASSQRHLARAYNSLGVLYNLTGRQAESEHAYLRSIDAATAIGDHELVGNAYANLGITALDRGEFDLARDHIERAMAAYSAAGRPLLPGPLYGTLANIALEQGKLAEADVHLGKALETARSVGDRRLEAMMLNNVGHLRRMQGRFDEAASFHQAAYEMRERMGDRVGQGRVQAMIAALENARGRFDEGAASAANAVEIAREAQDRLFEGSALSHLGDAQLGLGQYDAAEASYRAAQEVFAASSDRVRQLEAELRLARVKAKRGAAVDARADAARALADARSAKFPTVEIEAQRLLADLELQAGRARLARERLEGALQRAQETNQSGQVLELSLQLASLLLDEGLVEEAAPHFGRLRDSPPSAALLKAQARYAFARGQRPQALELLQQARGLDERTWSKEDEERLAAYSDAD